MTGQEIKQIVEEKCRLTDTLQAKYQGLTVFGWDVDDLPIQAMREYAELSGLQMKFAEVPKVMRIHYSDHPYCVFLNSTPVKVETHIVENYAVKNV